MPLPAVIEIKPLVQPVQACVTVPGSKSITNRALILAALAEGETILQGALWSEDTQVMVNALRLLGFEVKVESDAQESDNRTLTVQGRGGEVGAGGKMELPLELYVGNAGTAARFLAALTCLGSGIYRLQGAPRMQERPQEPLYDALRELGYCLDTVNNRLPADIHGGGLRSGHCCVSIEHSSQFASAVMLCAPTAGWHVRLVGINLAVCPYVKMTSDLVKAFPRRGGLFQVEPDASSGSYFWAVNALQPGTHPAPESVRVANWPDSGWQIDARFPEVLPLPDQLSRASDLGDAIMTAMVLAPLAGHPTRFVDLGRLRLQECERVRALRKELSRCGASVREREDTLEIQPSRLRGATIETYQDHRMAMCFSILGLKVSGMKIKNPACVRKTFPNFYQKLAAAPPDGLGVTILNASTGKPLADQDLLPD